MKVDKMSESITFSKKETKAVLTYIIKELKKPNSSKLRAYRRNNEGICNELEKELWEMCSSKMKKHKITKQHFYKFAHIADCLYPHYRTWPHYSGNKDFPIKSNYSTLPAWEQYAAYNHWKEDQLELRMDLLKHLKKELPNIVVYTPLIWR